MKTHILNFPEQMRDALSIARQTKINPVVGIQNILISGLGGSGIGGTFAAEWAAPICKVPIVVNKDYHVPSFVNQNTLVIISSYSGNTEETLSALQQSIEKKAKIIAISSGGKVGELSIKHDFEWIKIPGGNPPRTCLGYSLIQIIKILNDYGFVPSSFMEEMESSISLLKTEQENIKNEALRLAKLIFGKTPVIYSLGREAIAVRFRQQINENSKMLCWHHVIPEMNHNELVGWVEKNENLIVVALHTSYDDSRNKKRLKVCEPLFKNVSSNYLDILPKGNNLIEESFYLIHLTDWISAYLADIKKIDPIEVKVIDHLKNELSKG
jgi:glucose/mannose-6-phosphate isomerase